MKVSTLRLLKNGATLTSYLHEDREAREAVLIFPGGAYRYCAPGEGKPVAEAYHRAGYNAFVLEYSTIDGLFGSPKKDKEEVFDCAVADAAEAFHYLQEHCEELNIRKDRISIAGFSAGANLAFSTVMIHRLRPLSLILGYGVYSGECLSTLDIGRHDVLDLIDEDAPPVFLFLCQADLTVPSSESLKLALRYAEKKLPYELHCYVTGDHGLSLGTKESGVVNRDYATWFDHSLSFLKNIQRDTPLILGDVEDDLRDISISSRIGALMYHEKAWKIIEEKMPDIAFRARTDSHIRSVPLQRVWQWGMPVDISAEEMDSLLKKCTE